MPCPYFEPQMVVARPSVRLPLLDEYGGLCHATAEPTPSPEELRLRCCNRGYSRGVCPRFPAAEICSSIRFDVTKSTSEALELIYVEERDHAPLRWYSVRFVPSTSALDPQTENPCTAAQMIAFGRSFIRRFGAAFTF